MSYTESDLENEMAGQVNFAYEKDEKLQTQEKKGDLQNDVSSDKPKQKRRFKLRRYAFYCSFKLKYLNSIQWFNVF
jgi:hypothetical protein